ncbi:MAG TPA: translocation/assembly module TamB domain-containing protein, partial [Burkholderiaceae bacterium]|nr:translocation/assembly module TamB domain-containing protein [Burkholderiaceae bacterium]
AQALDARATLHPFAAWPLGELQARTEALDLSAFASAAPVTALSGEARAATTGADQPASVTLDLANALAGRWDENRLPVQRLTLALAARPDRPSDLELQRLEAVLGTPAAEAGKLTGSGRWSPQGWQLAAQLDALRPSRLDARAPAMLFSGPVTLAGGAASAPIELKADLTGALAGRGPVRHAQLALDASLQPLRVEVRSLRASAGGARASASGVLSRAAADAPWALKAKAALVDIDPAVWWPGADDSAWRRAPTRLNANADVDLVVPPSALAAAPLAALAALRGQAALTIANSLIAGVPLTGEAHLRTTPGAPTQALVRLDAAGNTLRGEGRIATAGTGRDDAWTLAIDAAALERLAPAFRLFRASADDAALAGALHATATLSGRWPTLATQGRLDAERLHVGTLGIDTAQAHWTLASAADARADTEATLTGVRVASGAAPGPALESLVLRLQGTGRAHTLDVRAESKSQPPAWAGALQPGSATGATGSRTLARLQAQGGLVDAAGSALAGWRGTLQQLDLRGSAPGAAPLLHTQDVGIDAQWAGGPARATVQPGRADVLGASLRWSRVAWQAAATPGGDASIEAEAEVDPLRIAPLLARAQPDFGWGGDLTIAGHLKLKSTPSFSADVVIERRAGDLTVTDELGTRALGLTDLRVGLAAADGTWNFTQGLAGRTLGVVAGAEVVRTSPRALWPAADAPLQGVIELRVDDLGTWGNWVPPGWRLGGALHSSASLGGRFGAPEYTGSVEGTRLAVRNFLEGVNISDGDVAIRLQGTTARIDRFTARGGNGTLRLDGQAQLGAAPQAQLTLRADKFQLLGRVDRRVVASGSGRLALDAKRVALDGRFDVDDGLIDFTRSDAPALAGDVTVVRAAGVPSPAAAASAAAAPTPAAVPSAMPSREVALDLRVGLGEKLRIRGRGLDARLRGDLHLTSPGGHLAVNGTVRAEDGTYAAYGQKLAIDRGLITFSGAVENPRLDIEATRPNLDVRVGVAVTGTAAAPRIRLFSEPELSEIDKLSWLVMGRASDGLGRGDTALLQRAALALLAGEGGGPTDSLTKALGLDDLSVRQTDGEVKETVIALGKQLSKRWYVGYERGLNATTGSFQLIYRIAQRFTLRAQSGDDNSVDVIWTWRWR